MCFIAILLFSSPIHRSSDLGKILGDLLLISLSPAPGIWKEKTKNPYFLT